MVINIQQSAIFQQVACADLVHVRLKEVPSILNRRQISFGRLLLSMGRRRTTFSQHDGSYTSIPYLETYSFITQINCSPPSMTPAAYCKCTSVSTSASPIRTATSRAPALSVSIASITAARRTTVERSASVVVHPTSSVGPATSVSV